MCFMCIYVCPSVMCVHHVGAGDCRYKKRELEHLELKAAVNCLVWILATKLGSSTRAESTFKC